jgi:excisionase family DNA binding protein
MTGTLLSVPDVAERLSCSERLVRNLINRGQLPYHRIGDLIRITEDDLQRYLSATRVEV